MEKEKRLDPRDVLITIHSIQSMDGEPEGVELITKGKYSVQGDAIRFSYMESELTGLKGTKTDFLVTPGQVVMSRQGTVMSQMIFHKGERQPFAYETPYGLMTMWLDTLRIDNALGENGGEMEIVYDIDMNKELLSRNRFRINVKELRSERERVQ